VAFGDLVASLRGRLEDPPADLEADVESFLRELEERGLVELGNGEA
jgi:hypothetical protein